MKNITEYLYENMEEVDEARLAELEANARKVNEGDESIKDEKTFRDYAENKFKEVFGDDLDEDQMKETIEGLLKDNKDLVDAGEWGELVGKLNKSFGK